MLATATTHLFSCTTLSTCFFEVASLTKNEGVGPYAQIRIAILGNTKTAGGNRKDEQLAFRDH